MHLSLPAAKRRMALGKTIFHEKKSKEPIEKQ
jgi:hypothetical protein